MEECYIMNLFLYNQKRNRDLDEYLKRLKISKKEYERINTPNSKVLIIGGGMSVTQDSFLYDTFMSITNIDLDPPTNDEICRINNIKGDYLLINTEMNYYDEVWALYSLPLYSPSSDAIHLFIYKALLNLKAGGVMRFFPLEYDDKIKLHTKDADYDMSTMECSECVMQIIENLRKNGLCVEIVDWPGLDQNRIEKTVIIKVPKKQSEKEKLDNIFKSFIDNKSNYTGIHYYLTWEE